MSLPDLQEPLSLLEQKDFNTAVDVLERKVTALPAHLGAHVLLAYAYEAQRRWDQALEAWENARFLMPNSPIAEDGKRRVLRHMDGGEDVEERAPFADFLASGPHPADRTEASAPSPEASPDADEPSEADDDAATEDDFGLSHLRRLAEREARQGGARPGLADATDLPSSPEESSTPEEQIEQLDDEGETEDLDRLIDELESARIDPDPEAAAPPPEPEAPGQDDDTEEVVSETLAKIHEGQDDYEAAARIYAQLAEQEPDRADEFRDKAAEMREKAERADPES